MAEVRYCTTEDGVRIAYTVEGEGPTLVICHGAIGSFSLDHLFATPQQSFPGFGRGRRRIRFDGRGTGLSQRDVADLSHAALVRDLEAVVRAAGLKSFSLWGPVWAGPRAIEYAARHPRQVHRLILSRTFARVLDVFSREMLEGLIQLARANWDFAARTFANMAVGTELPELNLRVAEGYRQSTSGDVVARALEQNMHSDVTGLLQQVKAPTLVISFREDTLFPVGVALGQQLAAAIPNGRLLILEATTDFANPETVANAIDAFLREGDGSEPQRRAFSQAGGALRTVLFTDIVGHTEMMQRLGDEKGRQVLREHERIIRDVLKEHGGTEVKTMGDGFMASFPSVTKGVECAVALQRAFAARIDAISARPEPVEGRGAAHGSTGSPRAAAESEPLHIRVGLNAGEPIEEEGDLFGQSVILAARIAAHAEGGEVLASLAVRELCAGKGFLFADRGDVALRGFEDPVRVFQVRWER
ncbi:MAG: adenylate/guanylate cyclase domain-containing protein [Chloroflexi bacterium]|nr:adenylate/guanylate cyclase domain-containing protein [Chloroflexota bacterium]